MELLQLTYFCDAAESQNFSHTAQKFRVPPSNVSQSIKRLERELSTSLFDRNSNRIVLNERGKAFYQKAKQALTLLADAKTEAADSGEIGTVRLAVQTNRRIVMETVQVFRRQYPGVDVITTLDARADAGSAHLTIGDDSLAERGLCRRRLLSESVYLAMSRAHPLAEKAGLSPKELAAEPFISMAPGNSMHRVAQDICRRWGFTPRIAVQCDDPFYIRKCVEMGMGISIMPAVSWRGQFSENICLKKIDCPPRNTYVYWDGGKYLPAVARAFLELLTAAFEAEAEPV